MSTQDRTGAAIVTGASRGLGLGIAQRLADSGHPVVLDTRGADALGRAAAIRQLGHEARAVQADVTSQADVERLVALAHERFGAPQVLVNNAGALPVPGTLDDLSGPRFLRGIAVDVRGAFNATRAVASSMREWIKQRRETETLTPADVGDAVVAPLAEPEAGTWSVSAAGLVAWDPFTPTVAR
jgi:NAD(P)-dependent dehydrogenase (short-subunit alcohol dehydrogenase family)